MVCSVICASLLCSKGCGVLYPTNGVRPKRRFMPPFRVWSEIIWGLGAEPLGKSRVFGGVHGENAPSMTKCGEHACVRSTRNEVRPKWRHESPFCAWSEIIWGLGAEPLGKSRVFGGVHGENAPSMTKCGEHARVRSTRNEVRPKWRHESPFCAWSDINYTLSIVSVFASSTPVLATATMVSPLWTRSKYFAILVAWAAAACVASGWSAARMGCTPQVRAILW